MKHGISFELTSLIFQDPGVVEERRYYFTLKKQLDKLKNTVAEPDKDTPEITDWRLSAVGRYYRPVKQQITLRLDADTLFWFKQQSDKYQTLINKACREYMNTHQQYSEK